jgi:hypothetical protein
MTGWKLARERIRGSGGTLERAEPYDGGRPAKERSQPVKGDAAVEPQASLARSGTLTRQQIHVGSQHRLDSYNRIFLSHRERWADDCAQQSG